MDFGLSGVFDLSCFLAMGYEFFPWGWEELACRPRRGSGALGSAWPSKLRPSGCFSASEREGSGWNFGVSEEGACRIFSFSLGKCLPKFGAGVLDFCPFLAVFGYFQNSPIRIHLFM